MSVVRRVTSELDENLSIFEKEKLCIFRNISRRKFFAKPVDALAPVTAPIPPQTSDNKASITKITPVFKTSPIGVVGILILFTRSAVINGIIASIITSPVIKKTVISEENLYSLMLFANVLIILFLHIFCHFIQCG